MYFKVTAVVAYILLHIFTIIFTIGLIEVLNGCDYWFVIFLGYSFLIVFVVMAIRISIASFYDLRRILRSEE